MRADSAGNLVADAPGRARFSLVMLPPLCDASTEATHWNATRTILSELLRWKRGLPRPWLVGVRSTSRMRSASAAARFADQEQIGGSAPPRRCARAPGGSKPRLVQNLDIVWLDSKSTGINSGSVFGKIAGISAGAAALDHQAAAS